MGLDMYIYKINTRIDSQEELEKLLSSIEEEDSNIKIKRIGDFFKHSDLHGYFQKIWLSRTTKNNPSPDDFNLVPLLLKKEDIEKVLEMARRQVNGEKVFEEARGFFWGASCQEDWIDTIQLFEHILVTTNFEKESIFYDSWW